MQKLAKSLVKREDNEVYDDFGPENPYWSDGDSSEEEQEKVDLFNFRKK